MKEKNIYVHVKISNGKYYWQFHLISEHMYLWKVIWDWTGLLWFLSHANLVQFFQPIIGRFKDLQTNLFFNALCANMYL